MSEPSPADQWSAFFATLIPTATIDLTDITGQTHKAYTSLAAADEFRVTAKLSEVADLAADGALKAAIQALQVGRAGPAEVLSIGRLLVREPKVLGIVAEAFAIAYPDEVEAAIVNVRAVAKLAKRLPANPTAANVFPVVELLGGVIPLASNVGAGIRNRIKSLQAPTT